MTDAVTWWVVAGVLGFVSLVVLQLAAGFGGALIALLLAVGAVAAALDGLRRYRQLESSAGRR